MINTTLLGIAFIGLVGCENVYDGPTRTLSKHTYDGTTYLIETIEDRTSMGIAASRTDLYVCENGRWRLVKYQVEKNISLISKYGKTTVPYATKSIPKSCIHPPKKDKIKVHTGGAIAPEVTGTDGFEGGD
ncbi:MAG: hypothetical protein QM492_01145 [Rhodobacterales bacterium]